MYICGGAKIEIVCIIMYLVSPNIKHILNTTVMVPIFLVQILAWDLVNGS